MDGCTEAFDNAQLVYCDVCLDSETGCALPPLTYVKEWDPDVGRTEFYVDEECDEAVAYSYDMLLTNHAGCDGTCEDGEKCTT